MRVSRQAPIWPVSQRRCHWKDTIVIREEGGRDLYARTMREEEEGACIYPPTLVSMHLRRPSSSIRPSTRSVRSSVCAHSPSVSLRGAGTSVCMNVCACAWMDVEGRRTDGDGVAKAQHGHIGQRLTHRQVLKENILLHDVAVVHRQRTQTQTQTNQNTAYTQSHSEPHVSVCIIVAGATSVTCRTQR
jgi:hypothetical protein